MGLAMVGVLAVQTSSAVRAALDVPRRSADAATASIASYTSGLADAFDGFVIRFGPDRVAEAKIAALEAEVRDLVRWREAAETMALRMDRYERLLDLVGETQGQSVTARVVAEVEGPFAASRIVNAGAANGVREGFAVINENGLVGRVVRVGEYTSRVLLVTDFSSRIPVMGSNSQDRALLVGDRGEGARLIEPETPDKITEGEVWVTSGDDGQTPMGLKVGRARRVDGEWRLDLAMRDDPVDFVRLVPPPDFAKPETVPPEEAGAESSPNSGAGLVTRTGERAQPASTAPDGPPVRSGGTRQ
jgi:rod shape-determining protein MreC